MSTLLLNNGEKIHIRASYARATRLVETAKCNHADHTFFQLADMTTRRLSINSILAIISEEE